MASVSMVFQILPQNGWDENATSLFVTSTYMIQVEMSLPTPECGKYYSIFRCSALGLCPRQKGGSGHLDPRANVEHCKLQFAPFAFL
jgi:hypothetical protein